MSQKLSYKLQRILFYSFITSGSDSFSIQQLLQLYCVDIKEN